MRKACLSGGLMLPIVLFVLSSCGSTNLYDWTNYDRAVYGYVKSPTEAHIEALLKVSEKLIRQNGGTRKMPPPGLCADYGYVLIQQGRVKEGKELLIKETQLYPESKPFVDRIIKRLEK